MKKFLLSIFCCLMAVFAAQAQDATATLSFASTAQRVSQDNNSQVWSNEGVTFTNNKASSSTNVANYSNPVRLYAKSEVVVEIATGTITKIEFTCSGTSYATALKNSVGGEAAASGSVVTITPTSASNSYTIASLTAQVRINKMTVTYAASTGGDTEDPDTPVVEAPAAPTLPADCNFDTEMTVEITGVAEGATAYYSLNSETDWVKGTSVKITETTTVYAKVVKDELSSEFVSATYTKNVVLEEGTMMITFVTNTTDKTSAATVDNFVSGHIKEHNFTTTLTCSATNNCYVGMSGLKMSSSKVNGSFTLSLGGSYKVKSIVVNAVKYGSDAATLSVNGAEQQTLTTSLADYTFDVNSEISQIKVDMTKRGYIAHIMVVCEEGADTPEPVAPNAPVLPESTTFEGSMMVQITGIAVDATAYYTTDESDPATSNTRVEYTVPFEITATTTVKAVAVNEVGASEPATATYTLVETIVLNNSSVAELIEAYNSGNNIADGATVVGYIVGCVDGQGLSKAVFGNEVTTASNILLADDPYETNVENCIPVQLPSNSSVRTALNLVDNSDNYQKKVILTGNVVAYFGVAGLKETSAYEFVEEVCHTLTVTEAGWATLFLGFNARIPSSVEAYIVTAVNNGWVSLTQVTGVLPSNQGVIVKAAAGVYKLFYEATATAVVDGNLLAGSLFNKNVDEEAYVLANGEDGVGLYKAKMTDGTWLNNANKAYLPASVANKAIAFYGFEWNGTTGVEAVEAEDVQDGAIYDITGRRVKAITAPGIYIINGKKVLVK